MMNPSVSPSEPPPRLNDFTMMLVIHDAFRRDLQRLKAGLQAASEPGSTVRASALLQRWQWIFDQVHHHHSGEDRWLWPALRQELAGDAAATTVLDDMEKEHDRLQRTLEDFDLTMRAFAADPVPARAAAALRAWSSFAPLLAAHLDHEERDAVPLLEYRLPPAALRRFERAQQRTLGLRTAMTRFFPWLLDEAPADRQAHVMSALPAPLRLLVRHSRRGYERQAAAAWT